MDSTLNPPESSFDLAILHALNAFARDSALLDTLIGFLSGNHLVKGGLMMALFWWAWFREPEDSPVRSRLISTLIACLVAIVTARILALNLPFRLRPIHNDSLAFLPPYGIDATVLDGWSSFPSDHAALFYALATGIMCASRKLGVFCLVYTTVIIALPRIYLGLHYPTDILAGALLGITLTLALQHSIALRRVAQPLQDWSTRSPGLFYALMFLLSYQIADIFNSARSFIKLAEVLPQL